MLILAMLILAANGNGDAVVGGITTALVVGLIFGLYFLPTGIALMRKMPNAAPIAFINLLLGWTAVGWVVALVMSSMQVHRPVVIVQPQP